MPDTPIRTYDYRYDDDDPYVYEGTGVLINRFGLKTWDELNQAERSITAVAIAALEDEPISGAFDLSHLKAIHKALFGEIYDWAGEIREKGFISKGSTVFCAAEFIEPYSEELFGKLKSEDYLHGLKHDEFAARMAFYIAEINALHPFREGNGRTQRVFANQLARCAGWELNLRTIDSDTLCDAYITAMRDTKPLETLLSGSVTRK